MRLIPQAGTSHCHSSQPACQREQRFRRDQAEIGYSWLVFGGSSGIGVSLPELGVVGELV